MGRIWMPGGGGGADLDVVTAGANDVVAPKVIVGPDGEPISGNLVDQPLGVAASGFRNGGSNVFFVDFPKGAYRQESSVGLPSINVTAEQIRNAGGLTAAKLAQGQSAFGLTGTYKGLGNAAAADVRSGKTFSTAALSNAAGTMPEQGGSTTTPGTAAKTIVAANRYVTGSIIVAGDANLVPGNIKKNVTIFGVKGTWSGYVPVATDLYLRGQNPGGLNEQHSSSISFDEGQITLSGAVSKTLHFANNVSFVGFTRLNFEVYRGNDTSSQTRIEVMEGTPGSASEGAKSSTILASTSPGNYTMSIDISALQMSRAWYIRVISLNYTTSSTHGAIYHIWLS